MDITKFLALLESGQLHFARANLLTDKWEGALDYQSMQESYRREIEVLAREYFTNYINSWHLSEYESVGMWDFYLRGAQGIAIRTTWARLTEAITCDWAIRGGKVNYVNYQTTRIPTDNQYSRFMYKRESFDFEREARLILWSETDPGPAWSDPHESGSRHSTVTAENASPGYGVNVDLDTLVGWIYVAPGAPEWVVQLVTQIVGRYGHEWPVVQSDLGSDRLR